MIRRSFCLRVVGVTHKNEDGTSRQEIIRNCSEGESIRLVPEPDNRYDQYAIKVCRANGEQLGYIDSADAYRLTMDMENGWTYDVYVHSVTHQPGTRSYGLLIGFDVLTMSRKTEERLAKREQRLAQERAQRRAQAPWWKRLLGWYWALEHNYVLNIHSSIPQSTGWVLP